MPFVEYIALDGEDIIGLWENSENLEDLLYLAKPKGELLEQYNQIKIEKRKKEFLITQILLQELLSPDARIIKDENGKPSIANSNTKVSISHADQYSGILLSETKECGIDIEQITPRIKQVAPKFVSEYEELYVSSIYPEAYYTVIWCTKEAMYKWYAKKNVDFKENMIIHPFTLQQSGGPVYYEFVKSGKKRTQIAQYRLFNKHIIAWVLDDEFR